MPSIADPVAGASPVAVPPAGTEAISPSDPKGPGTPPAWLVADAKARLAVLEREARALGNDPAAALLFQEIGLLWEDPLRNPRHAAVAYQHAYKLNPRLLPNLRAARRLFSDVGNWQMVVQLLDAELGADENLETRAALRFEKATVLQTHLGKERDARTLYEQILADKPSSLVLLTQLERVFAAFEDHAALVRTYREIVDRLPSSPLRAHYLTTGALLLEERLGQAPEAALWIREAFAMDRTDPLLISAMIRVADRDDDTAALVDALGAEAAALGADGAVSYLAISRIHERQGHPELALQALQSARRLQTNHPLVLAELASIYQAQGQNEKLADVLLAWAVSLRDDTEVIALNLRLAALYEELGKYVDAEARYEAVLSRDPRNNNALAGLGKLNYRAQNWEALLSVYDREIVAVEDPRQKANRTFRSAELLEQKLGRHEEAIARYQRAMQLLPGYLPAQKALTRILEKQERYADLVALYEQELQLTRVVPDALAILRRMASLYEDRLNDLNGAVDCLNRALKLSPGHVPTLQSLEQLLEQAGRWKDLITALEQEATLVTDTKQVLALHHRVAEILEGPLQDPEGATDAYERVLALSPSYVPALKALGTLYTQRNAWPQLIAMYRSESETATTDHAASLMYRIGELYEQKLADENQAIAAYQETLTLAPNYFPALKSLARIYRRQEAWENLIEVLRAEAANRTDPTERAAALFQAACIWEDRLDRRDLAISVCQEVLRLSPSHAPALRSLERLLEATQDVKERVAILDHELNLQRDLPRKHAAAAKLALLYLDTLREPSRAAALCEVILEEDPANLWALKTLERIRAQDRPKASALLAQQADRSVEPVMRASLRIAAALETDPLRPANGELLREVFAEHPSIPQLAFALERSVRAGAGDTRALAALYEMHVPHVSLPDERLYLMMRIADLSETRLEDPGRALHWYEQALEIRPDYLPALQGLRRLAMKRTDWGAARRALESEVLVALDPTTRLESQLMLAQVSLSLGDDDAAVHHYRSALVIEPMHPGATQGLETLLVRKGGAEDLARLHEQRAENKALRNEPVAAADTWVSAAKLWQSANRPDDAERAVKQALTLAPTHLEALELKAVIAQAKKQYGDVAAALSLRLQQGGDAPTVTALHLRLGALHQEHLHDLTRATAHYQSALSTDPNNLEALEHLCRIYVADGNWSAAADTLQRVVTLPLPHETQAAHLKTLGNVLEEGLADLTRAISAYQRALELAPTDDEVLDRLVSLHERTGNDEGLRRTLEASLPSARTPESSVHRRLKLGRLHQKAGRWMDAAAVLAPAAVEAPNDLETRVVLADVYGRSDATYPQAITMHRELLERAPDRVESLHALHRLWLSKDQSERAFVVAGILSGLKTAAPEEMAFHQEHKRRFSADPKGLLGPTQWERLIPPAVPPPVVEITSVLGPYLYKLFPNALEQARVDKRADRIKSDQALFKLIQTVSPLLGVSDVELYQTRRQAVTAEPMETPTLLVGNEWLKKYLPKEQRFILARALFDNATGAVLFRKMSVGEVTDLFGNCVRLVQPNFNALGRKHDDIQKQLKKALPRKSLKALEAPAQALGDLGRWNPATWVSGFEHAANRAGALACGDMEAAVWVLLKDIPASSHALANEQGPLDGHLKRTDLQELVRFAISDTFFDLRHALSK